MNRETSHSDFFSASGTLPPDSPSYIKRPADDELLKLTKKGTFCYVLATHQMGKSSLMSRTFAELRSKGVKTVIIDLARFGFHGLTVEQWYLGLLSQLEEHLPLSEDPFAWWLEHGSLSHIHRFTDFLRDVILTEISGEIVIFIDEIDLTLRLDFTDDFFAAIRAMYNARAHEPEFKRLTFVLLGVALPAELIKEPSRTPFNIGQGITLEEFSKHEASLLQEELEAIFPTQGQAIFERIYYWSSGHPYLTQKLCLTIAKSSQRYWIDEQIDAVVDNLFLSQGLVIDNNIKLVQQFIEIHPQRHKLVDLYQIVYKGENSIEDEGQSIIHNQLKLSGLVKAENGYLKVRNEIYRRLFDLDWARKWGSTGKVADYSPPVPPTSPINRAPPNRREIMRRISTALVLLVVGLLVWAWVAVSSMVVQNSASPVEAILPTVTPYFTSASPTVTSKDTAATPSVPSGTTATPEPPTPVPPSATPEPPTPVPPTPEPIPSPTLVIFTPSLTSIPTLPPTATLGDTGAPVPTSPINKEVVKSEDITFTWEWNGGELAPGHKFAIGGFRDGEWLQLGTATSVQRSLTVYMPAFGNFETTWQWYVVVIDSGGNEISPRSATQNFGISLSSGDGGGDSGGVDNRADPPPLP